ncbi:MAG TPA: DUF4349 domain-containing protein [Gaiellaceae bacterium]|jgi:hypothetical protein
MSELLLNEIRATRPAAPERLRERVRALAAEEPVREPFLGRLRFTWGWRRLVLVAPAAAAVALVAAGVIGLSRGDVGGGGEHEAGGTAPTALESAASPAAKAPATQDSRTAAPPSAALATPPSATTVAPTPGQLQRYQAELSLRVDDVEALSSATKRAQQIALSHGGSVASLQYEAPTTGVGSAQIVLRIPTARVDDALAQLSALGTITGQRYGIEDLQQQADGLQTQIEQVQRRIAQILAQLESDTISAETRAVLQSRLNASRQRLTQLRESLRATNAEGRTATVYLTLTTEQIEPGAVGGGSRLDGIKDVLAWEAIAALYALVVAGPILLLGIVVWLGLRLARRRETARLLEQN